jgi:hypothetical protein
MKSVKSMDVIAGRKGVESFPSECRKLYVYAVKKINNNQSRKEEGEKNSPLYLISPETERRSSAESTRFLFPIFIAANADTVSATSSVPE